MNNHISLNATRNTTSSFSFQPSPETCPYFLSEVVNPNNSTELRKDTNALICKNFLSNISCWLFT